MKCLFHLHLILWHNLRSLQPSLDQVVWIRSLAGDIAMCSWARHFTLTVPLSTQGYKWVLANLMQEVKPSDGLASYPGGSRNTPSCFML